jgi:hypothetical protein
VLVRLAIGHEDELAVVQIVNKVEHSESMLATGMPCYSGQGAGRVR